MAVNAQVVLLTARVELDGVEVATIDRITVGGGTQVVTVDGTPETRQHPTFHRFAVRLLSPDRMISDVLHDVETFDEATEIGLAYAERRAEHAGLAADLAKVLNG